MEVICHNCNYINDMEINVNCIDPQAPSVKGPLCRLFRKQSDNFYFNVKVRVNYSIKISSK